ncbi:MAG: STAS/SEC14 domain-containing protein [Planctomycetes bacterium]|nr:STAS/SEC14 domain-containing protein [Planctomycetota bacterium]
MTVQTEMATTSNVLHVHVSGKLTKEDYAQFVPRIEAIIRDHGAVRILFDMHDFHGWNMAAMWEDMKFGFRHFNDIERIAMVGEKAWEHGMAAFCKPFTKAKVRYFDRSEEQAAIAWVEAD